MSIEEATVFNLWGTAVIMDVLEWKDLRTKRPRSHKGRSLRSSCVAEALRTNKAEEVLQSGRITWGKRKKFHAKLRIGCPSHWRNTHLEGGLVRGGEDQHTKRIAGPDRGQTADSAPCT
jgi:hypothetical protein